MTARQVLTSCADIPVGDYVSEGLSIIIPDACFPHMVIGDKAHHPWPYLRREVKHNWYCDRREPGVGFLNRDEAMLLYNLALQFRGKPALEIGSWMGWSTCHLALAGVALDVIDPVLANPEHASSIRDSLIAAEVLEHVRLYALASPDGIRELAQLTGMQWNLFFIDGNHETPAPAQDAQECLKHAAQDAMMIFHDLTAPAVEEGLHVLWRQGWHVLVYQTMQIIGVAWRGAVQPVPHKPDPSVAWSLPLHLIKYPVCGASPDEDARRLSQEIATRDQAIEHLRSALVERDRQLGSLQEELAGREAKLVCFAEQAQTQQADLERVQADMTERDRQLGSLQEELAGREAKLVCFAEQAQTQQADLERVQADMTERDRQLGSLQEELAGREAKLVCFAEQVQTQQAELVRVQADMTERDRQLGSLQEELTGREAKLAELKLMHDEVQAREGEIHRLTLTVASRSQEMDRLSAEIERLLLTLGALHNSTSWKLTRPLRGIKNGMRFLRRQARRFGRVVKQEAEFLSPNMPHILRIVRATGTVTPRALRRALGSIRSFSTVWRYQRQMATLLTSSGLFDPVFYLAQNPDVRENGIDPVMHYLTRGAMERRDPHALFDTSFYCDTNPDVAQAGVNPLAHYLLYGAMEGRDPHALFDTSFYCDTNPDVAQAGVNPLAHYLLYGAMEGRDPHALFDTSFYCDTNPDVAQAGVNPLAHYLLYGAMEGRDPHALFDTSFYCDTNPDVAQAGVNPLAHYLLYGAMEGRDPHALFDTSFYCDTNPDVAQAGVNPLAHYLLYGAMERRDPHALFDTSFYCDTNPDVAQAGVNPLAHYLLYGAMEGRDPHALFDTSFYCDTNPDVAQAGANPLAHYLLYGAMEGRDPHALFDTSFYCDTNPDVAQAGANPLAHYLLYGAMEGRDPHALFDTSFYLEQKPHVGGLGLNPLVHFLTEGPTGDFDPFSPTPALPETNICIVTPDIVGPVKNGGIGTACYHFARVLAKAGYAVSVLFTGDVTDCQKAHWRNVYAKMRIKFIALSDTPPVTRLVYGSSWFDERSWRVFEYLRKAQFSVVHFQDWQANGFWTIRAKQVGLAFDQTTLTVMTHSCTQWINEGMKQFSASPFETAKLVWAETYCMEYCDLLLSPSRYMLQWLETNHIHTPQHTLLTPYAWADSAMIDSRGRAHIDSDHLIFFGRLETRKGLHIFGEAIRLLRQEGCALPRALSFLGKHASVQGQPSEAYLESLRRDLPTVKMHIINDFDYAHALDYIRQTRGLVVMPSILDNYPLTVLESIQNGLPFIAATTGGIPEMVDARVAFEPNPASLAALLKTRRTLDHRNVQHKYSAALAAKIWCDLHAHILAAPALSDQVRPVQNTTQAPQVSVCIPFFNHQQYLETLVTALAHQNYPAFEVILVNDGSAPEAAQEFERVARRSRDRRFHFFTTDNHGPGAARNFAAAQATGEFLLFFDADNVPKGADFIGTLVRALQCSHMDCVTCPYDIVSTDHIFVTERDVVATYRPIGACLVAGFFENILGDATMIIKRCTFQQLGGFSTQRAAWEDHEFLLNLCFKGFKLTTFPEAIFYYRQNPQGRNLQADNFRNYQSLFQCLQEAPSEDLARIISTVSGPMLVGQPGSPTASLVAR